MGFFFPPTYPEVGPSVSLEDSCTCLLKVSLLCCLLIGCVILAGALVSFWPPMQGEGCYFVEDELCVIRMV